MYKNNNKKKIIKSKLSDEDIEIIQYKIKQINKSIRKNFINPRHNKVK